MSFIDQIHSRAVEVSGRYKRAEAELIDVLQQAEVHRVFLKRGHPSLFHYVATELGLAENTAYTLITVARKARQVPELKIQLQAGSITLSNARRIAAVLTPENQDEWIKKASELSNRQLEKEIVKVRPQAATPERATYVSTDRVKLELGLSERAMLKLRRAQDLLSQSKKRPVSLEETIEALTGEFLNRRDPIERAKRHRVRRGYGAARLEQPSERVERLVTRRVASDRARKREPIRAEVLHQVNLRDQRRCAHQDSSGMRCNQARWVEVHHKIPVSQGGKNTLENLITLCSAHHRFWHLQNNDLTHCDAFENRRRAE